MPLTIPELGTGEKRIQLIHWLIGVNSQVIEGERLAELLVDSVLVYLEAEATGRISQLVVGSGNSVVVGQAVATLIPDEDLPH